MKIRELLNLLREDWKRANLRYPIILNLLPKGSLSSVEINVKFLSNEGEGAHLLTASQELLNEKGEVIETLSALAISRCKMGEETDPVLEDLCCRSRLSEKRLQPFFIPAYWSTFLLAFEFLVNIFGKETAETILQRKFGSLEETINAGVGELYLNVAFPFPLYEFATNLDWHFEVASTLFLARKMKLEEIFLLLSYLLSRLPTDLAGRIENILMIFNESFAQNGSPVHVVKMIISRSLKEIFGSDLKIEISWDHELWRYVWEIKE